MIEIRKINHDEINNVFGDSANALIEENWRETFGRDKKYDVLKAPRLSFDDYMRQIIADAMIVLGVFDSDKIIGYSILYVQNHPLFQTKMAHVIAIYVSKRHRGLHLGWRLLNETERMATEAGADCILWSGIAGTSFDLVLRKSIGDPITSHYLRALLKKEA